MKVAITFSDGIPSLSVWSLQGTIMLLWGRTEHIVSKDPMNDTISTWFNFFIERKAGGWRFDYRSNCKYSRDEDQRILLNLLNKANQAIMQNQATDLSQEFNALNMIEPYSIGGLFSRMDERYEPVIDNKDYNRVMAEMREKLKSNITVDEIESDEHLKSFVFQIPLETIWVDETSNTA